MTSVDEIIWILQIHTKAINGQTNVLVLTIGDMRLNETGLVLNCDTSSHGVSQLRCLR